MALYKVGYSYHEGGYVLVNARDEEHAEHIVTNELGFRGLDCIGEYDGYSTTNRNYGVDEVEKVR